MTGTLYVKGQGEYPALDLTDEEWRRLPPVAREAAVLDFDVKVKLDWAGCGVVGVWLFRGDRQAYGGGADEVRTWLAGYCYARQAACDYWDPMADREPIAEGDYRYYQPPEVPA